MTCQVVVFRVLRKRCRNLVSLRPHFSSFACRSIIQRGADDMEFGMLIMHRSLYVSMSHRLHDGGQVPRPHENSDGER
jgi:hypothetical protein